MEFTGAVLVSNTKTKQALEDYHNIITPIERGVTLLTRKAEKLWEELGWWDKFRYSDEWYPDHINYLRKCGIRRGWSGVAGFVKLGWLSEDHGDIYHNHYYSSYSYSTIYKELDNLVRAGEPVYLNPTQAQFVNKYCGE